MTTVSIGQLTLESNDNLHEVELAYERAGNKSAPAILICHALTGDQYAVGTPGEPGWWAGLIGPGKAVDTELFQVITFNVLGGCNGSTGPLSINPKTGSPYRASFPELTIRDMVRAERKALEALGIDHLAAVIGGSLGGMKTLEWARLYPEFLDTAIALAVTPYYGDYGVAFNHIGIQAIENDPDFQDGEYDPNVRLKGFEIARMAGMVTYRSGQLFNGRFGRARCGEDFEVQSYLDYQGRKLADRFDPNSYLVLLKAMNTHDVEEAELSAELLSISYSHDLLYPGELMVPWVENQPNAKWEKINTDFGHDGFLVEFEKWDHHVRNQLKKTVIAKSHALA
ncbi:homoserine O-acetyltransferase [Planococcus sp. ISL-109]|uniref:homoserine O-acetyltransferase MetX n=1 Tax=Planococcus sp. ISL-109 TaxID=2819166 RepID=UPI001BECB50F|nr:homoserine O-acetyltransferase [Planococcus sp. ISL-109]MBT2583506.1 homoserine O-acetyltransferase [Planococcus sp. ISL-109]